MVSIIRTKCCHLSAVTSSCENTVVYFDCSWSRKKMLTDNTELVNIFVSNGVSSVYHIADEFCEEVRCNFVLYMLSFCSHDSFDAPDGDFRH